jgi:drug/metabolite transporter (DMT)-like permease
LAGLATTVACVFCILQFVVLKPASALDVAPEVIWLSMLNATACTVLPVLMIMMAIERIGPGLTSQIGMIGPMSTLTMGALILNEPFNAWILMGTALVLGGVFWVTQAPKIVE